MHFKDNLPTKRPVAALLSAAVLAGAAWGVARLASPSKPPAKLQTPAPASTPQERDMDRLLKEAKQAFSKTDFTLAEQVSRTGLDKAQALHNQEYTAKFLECLLSLYWSMGRFDKALDCGSQALVIRQAIGRPTEIIASLNNLSAVYYNLGQFERVLDFAGRALAVMEKSGITQKMAFPLLNLGNAYNALGQSDKAQEYYMRALSLFEKGRDLPDTATTLNNLGSVYNRLEQTGKALDCYNRARSLFETMKDPGGGAFTLDNLGNLYYSASQFQKALDYYDRALAIRKNLPNQQDIATTLTSMGAAYYGLRRFQKALDCYHQALVIKEKLGSSQNTIVTLNDMGDAYIQLNRLNEAQAVFDRAVHNFEKVSLEVGDPAQVGALQNTLPLYAEYAGLRLRQRQPTKALALLERGRAQGLTRQIAQSRVDYAALFSPNDAARWRDANAERTLAENLLGAAENRVRQQTDEAGKNRAAREQKQAKQRDERAERQLTLLRTELRQRYPQFLRMNDVEPPVPAHLDDLARRHPDTLFLQWAVTDDETLLLALGQKDGIRGFRIPQTTKALHGKAQAWRDAIEAAGKLRSGLSGAEAVRYTDTLQSEPRRAQDLYHILFDPLAKAGLLAPGRYRRLVLVSDGPLLDLPLAALVTAADAGKSGRTPAALPARLLDRYAVSSAVSFAVLDWPVLRDKSEVPLFCVADTADGTMPERFGGGSTAPAPALPAVRQGGEAPLRGLRAGYGPLEYARREGRQIVGMFPGAVGLAGPLAREAVVRDTMCRADILHFAVHNIPDTHNAMRSWLLLAQEDASSPYDGRLEAREVASMRLRARMTVLSACESGRGQQRGGDGLIGMAWAFRGAGCPCVVAAQWKVSDAASCSLMTGFYRGLLAGHSKDEAMQEAMQAVRREEGHQSPFFWAGFEVIGDTTPLFPAAPDRTARR